MDNIQVKLSEQGKAQAKAIDRGFSQLILEIKSYCPSGDEMTLCRQKLEEARWRAFRSLVSLPQNTEE